MIEPAEFARLSQCRIHVDQEPWRERYQPRHATEVERYYRGRFVKTAKAVGLGPVKVCRPNSPFDLVISGHACELKVCRARAKSKGRRGGRVAEVYQGLIHDPAKRRHLNGDVVIVLCVDYMDRLWPFVVPRLLVGDRRTIEITSHPTNYAGQWAPYLAAFDYLRPV